MRRCGGSRRGRLIGGVFAVALGGSVLSVATLVGFVTLFGIAARNDVLLVNNYQRLLAAGVPLAEAVRRGPEKRQHRSNDHADGGQLGAAGLAGGAPGDEPLARERSA